MKFQDYQEYLKESEIKSFRIGYGIRDSKTHELIKGFHNLHFYQDLKKFKEENAWLKSWKITNEFDEDGSRKFSFWGDENEKFDTPKDEESTEKDKFGKNVLKTS